jgi:hypothetical protein
VQASRPPPFSVLPAQDLLGLGEFEVPLLLPMKHSAGVRIPFHKLAIFVPKRSKQWMTLKSADWMGGLEEFRLYLVLQQ